MATTRFFEVRDRAWAYDVVLAALLWLGCAIVTLATGAEDIQLAWAVELAMVLPLVFRRAAPRVALAGGIAAGLVHLLVHDWPTASVVAVPLLVYSLARWSGGGLGRGALWAGLAGALAGPLRWATYLDAADLEIAPLLVLAVACAGIVATAYVVGRARRDRSAARVQREQSATEQQRLRTAEAEQRSRASEVNERNRIARELHDIVAHSLSVIVVQAEGGRALAAKRGEEAGAVLGTIADTGRAALEEMRRIVGVLRNGHEPESEAYAPMPGLADIDELVRKTTAGAELSVYGSPPEVSPAVGLVAYRIVQESLTNVLKHAGPDARVRVTLAYTADSIEVEVLDDGRGAAAGPTGDGHGLQGMRERVAVLGGELTAGPRPGGGFGVRASLPLATPVGRP